MKKIGTMLLGYILLLSSCSPIKESLFLKIPATAKPDSVLVDVNHYSEKYKKYDCVYLEYEHSIDNYEVSSWNWKTVKRYKYIVLNPENKQLTTFELSIGSKTLVKNVFLKITNPDGTGKIYRKNDIALETDSDGGKRYKFIYPSVVLGSVIEEGFELNYDFMDSSPSFEEEILIPKSTGPIEKYSFTYAYPESWKLQFKEYQNGVKMPVIEKTDEKLHKKYISYSASNIDPLVDEPYSPYVKEFAQYLQFRILELTVMTSPMDRNSYNANDSWSKMLVPYYSYVSDGKSFFDFNVGSMTDKLTEGTKNETDKVRKITDYVQQNIEIKNDGKDRDYSDVLKEKKGNIFRITGLVQNMLSKLKIKSEFLLVHSAQEGFFDKSYYSASQFGLPALKIMADSKQILVIPYIKNLPFGYVPDIIQGQPSLLVSNKNSSFVNKGREEFWTVPIQENQQNGYEEIYDVKIEEDGNITVKEEKIVTGLAAGNLRNLIQNLKDDERDKFIKNLLTYSDGNVKINSFSVDSLKNYNDPLKINLNYSIDNLITVTPDEILFQTGGLFSPTSLKKYKINSNDRVSPIHIYSNEYYKKKIRITVPENWSLDNKPENVSFSNLFGSVKAEYTLEKNILSVYQERLLIPNSKLKDSINELVEISGDHSKLSMPTLIFKVN